jgi:hypothetical protein
VASLLPRTPSRAVNTAAANASAEDDVRDAASVPSNPVLAVLNVMKAVSYLGLGVQCFPLLLPRLFLRLSCSTRMMLSISGGAATPSLACAPVKVRSSAYFY